MVAITIRDVPDGVRDALAARAAASGRSLQEYLSRELRELVDRPDPAALRMELKRVSEKLPAATLEEIVADVRGTRT